MRAISPAAASTALSADSPTCRPATATACGFCSTDWRHHTFTNLKDRDYIWVPLSKAEYDRRGPFGRALARFYRTSLGVGAYYLCAIWLGTMISPRRATVQKMRRVYIIDCFWVLVFLLGQLAVLAIGAAGPGAFAVRVLMAIVLPFLLYNWMVGFVSFLNHTHPAVPWFARREEWSFYIGQVHCTVHMGVPRWMIFFVTDLGLHGAHHIEPRIPIWRLTPAEDRIVADAGAEIVPGTMDARRSIATFCAAAGSTITTSTAGSITMAGRPARGCCRGWREPARHCVQ